MKSCPLINDHTRLKWEEILTCGAAAAETAPVLPSGAQEASRQQNALGLVPHTAAPSVPAALTQFSHDALIQDSSWSKSLGEGSICAQAPAAESLFCQWPRRTSSSPLSKLLLQPRAASVIHWSRVTWRTYYVLFWVCCCGESCLNLLFLTNLKGSVGVYNKAKESGEFAPTRSTLSCASGL